MFIKAKIIRPLELIQRQSAGGDTYSRQDIEVQTLEIRPQTLRFEFYNGLIDKAKSLIGKDVQIEFRIKGNKSKSGGKIYNNLVASDVFELVNSIMDRDID